MSISYIPFLFKKKGAEKSLKDHFVAEYVESLILSVFSKTIQPSGRQDDMNE
jgi:hypothetical protein